MNTLLELTSRRSGIILRDGKRFSCDWSHIQGLPIKFTDGIYGLGEPIPLTLGHYHYNLEEDSGINLAGIDLEGRPKPERGTVYDIGGVIVICPDGWD